MAAGIVVGAAVMTLATACVAATAGLCLIGVGAAAGGASALTSYMFTGDDGQGTLSWSGGLKAVGFGATVGAVTGPFAGAGFGMTQALKTSQVQLSHTRGRIGASSALRSSASGSAAGQTPRLAGVLKQTVQAVKPRIKGKITFGPSSTRGTATGAANAANGVRLNARLVGQEIAGGHAWLKHRAEFPGLASRSQFAQHIENVVLNGISKPISQGRTAYWLNGTVVIRNPGAVDGGTAFRPVEGINYYIKLGRANR